MDVHIYLGALVLFFLSYFAVIQRALYRPANFWMKWLRRVALYLLPAIYFLSRGVYAVLWWLLGVPRAIFVWEGMTFLAVLVGGIVISRWINQPHSALGKRRTAEYCVALILLMLYLPIAGYRINANAGLVAMRHQSVTEKIAADYRREVAPEDNAFPLYIEMAKAFDRDGLHGNPLTLIENGVNDPAFIAAIAGRQPQVDLARQAAKRPDCLRSEYPRNASVLQWMPVLQNFRLAGQLLGYSARWKATQGDINGAIGDLLRIFPTADHVWQSTPAIMGYVLGRSLHRLGDQTCVQILPSITSPSQLDQIQLPHTDFKSPLLRAIRQEGMLVGAMNATSFGPRLLPANPIGPVIAEPTDIMQDTRSFSFRQAMGLFAWRSVAMQNNVTLMNDLTDAAVESLELPAGKLSARWNAAINSNPNSYHAGLKPLFETRIHDHYLGQASRDCARIAIAATRYRLDHGDYPDASNLLTPKYLAVWPTDLLDDQPMRMKKRDDGSLVIWSVGDNQKDDGGNVDAIDGRTGRTFDLGFLLLLPELKPS